MRAAVLAIGLAAAAPAADPPARAAPAAASDPADRAAIARLIRRYFAALTASDTRALVALYAEDGAFLQPGASTWVGRAAIGRAYDALFRGTVVDATVHVTEVTVLSPRWALGRAVADGAVTSRRTRLRQDSPTQELFVFRRDGGGWRIARFAFSAIAAPPRRAP